MREAWEGISMVPRFEFSRFTYPKNQQPDRVFLVFGYRKTHKHNNYGLDWSVFGSAKNTHPHGLGVLVSGSREIDTRTVCVSLVFGCPKNAQWHGSRFLVLGCPTNSLPCGENLLPYTLWIRLEFRFLCLVSTRTPSMLQRGHVIDFRRRCRPNDENIWPRKRVHAKPRDVLTRSNFLSLRCWTPRKHHPNRSRIVQNQLRKR